MKTLTFKLDRLSKTDLQTIDQWLSALRWVWNEGLRRLEELDAFTAAYAVTEVVGGKEKKIWHRAPCCPIPWQYRRIDKNLPWGEDNLAPYTYMARKKPYAPFCSIIPSGNSHEFVEVDLVAQRWVEECTHSKMPVDPAFSESLSQTTGYSLSAVNAVVKAYQIQTDPESYEAYAYREPLLTNSSNFSLAGYFAHKRHPDKPWLKAVPAWFIRGTCRSLADAWARYKSGKGGKPRFKSRNDGTDTLIHEDGKSFKVTAINDRDGMIRIPKLGAFRVKHLWKDWGETRIRVVKIAKKPDAYYLQLTGDIEDDPVKLREVACTITAPEKLSPLLGTTDTGKEIRAYQPDPKLLRRKEKLQQQLARQTFEGANWRKTKLKIARIDRRMAEQAKNHNQKLTTFLVRTYGDITLAGGVGERRVIRKPKKKARPKTIDPIHYDPNGAERVAEINRMITSQRGGQFIMLLKQKAKRCDRVLTISKDGN